MKLYLALLAVSLTVHTKYPTDKPVEPGYYHGVCSAVLIAPDIALSAAHCYDHKGVLVWVRTSKEKSFSATVLYKDVDKDIAILSIEKPIEGPVAEFGRDVKITDPIYIVSSEDDMPGTYAQGIVENFIYEDGQHFVVHSAGIVPGASGSGLFDKKGRLIGINTLVQGPLTKAVALPDIAEVLLNAATLSKL